MALQITLFAKLNIITTYAYLGEVVKAIGGERVKVDVLADSRFDPHFITPKPSLILKVKRADLLVINGAQLEIGWLPPLLRAAQNPKVKLGSKGFLDVSHIVTMIDKPKRVSRAMGDVHPDGNPHFSLDPHNIVDIAKLIEAKLVQIDTIYAAVYKNNLEKFLKRWQIFLDEFDAKMAECKTKKVVQYHELFNYFLHRYDIKNIGNIEPLPGITPSSKHTLELIMLMRQESVKKILQDVYHERKTARFIAKKTGAKVVIMPHDVGAVKSSDTLESFYKTIADRVCN